MTLKGILIGLGIVAWFAAEVWFWVWAGKGEDDEGRSV